MESFLLPCALLALQAVVVTAQEPTPTGNTEGESNNHKLIFIVTFSVLGGCAVLGTLAILFWKLCWRHKAKTNFRTCGDINVTRKRNKKNVESGLPPTGKSVKVVAHVPKTKEQFLGVTINSNDNRNSGITDFAKTLDATYST